MCLKFSEKKIFWRRKYEKKNTTNINFISWKVKRLNTSLLCVCACARLWLYCVGESGTNKKTNKEFRDRDRETKKRVWKCVQICAVVMDRVIHAHHTIYIHIVVCVRANIVRIVTHVVWCAFQKFDSATFAIVDTGNVATTNAWVVGVCVRVHQKYNQTSLEHV